VGIDDLEFFLNADGETVRHQALLVLARFVRSGLNMIPDAGATASRPPLDRPEDLPDCTSAFRRYVVEQRPVDVQVGHACADRLARGLGPPADRERPEVEGLGRGHELDAEHAVRVVENLAVLERGVHAHRHEVFLVGRSRDRLNRRRRRQDALLDDQVSAVYWLSMSPE
jgi:hypothetical protein